VPERSDPGSPIASVWPDPDRLIQVIQFMGSGQVRFGADTEAAEVDPIPEWFSQFLNDRQSPQVRDGTRACPPTTCAADMI
jgi:hypothetical protein